MNPRYVVLAPGTDPEAVRDRIEEVWDELDQTGGPLVAYSFTEEAGGVVLDVWRNPRRETTRVRLAEDTELGTLHFEIEALSDSAADSIASALRNAFPARSFEQLRDAADSTDAASLVRMALASPASADDRALVLIADGLRSEDEAIRDAAIIAAALTRWEQLAEPLEEALEAEEEEPRRATIERAIADCRERER